MLCPVYMFQEKQLGKNDSSQKLLAFDLETGLLHEKYTNTHFILESIK